ncbi:MAG: response regulator [Ginsengibacter sp.]
MSSPIKILIVEDEGIITEKIFLQLEEWEYEISGTISNGEDVLSHIEENQPDIILMDIHLKGKLDGIETATEIKKHENIPIIYVTANTDEATFNRAIVTKPAAFISKPFKQLDLQRTILLAIFKNGVDESNHEDFSKPAEPIILSDRIFVRCRHKMVKILTKDILYIEADRNYSRIYTTCKEFLLSTTLKTIEERLPGELFIRIHRSYIINLSHVDEVCDGHVIIINKPIPLSAALKDHLLDRIYTL